MSPSQTDYNPVARPESIVQGPQWRFTVISDGVLRYEWAADGVFEDRASTLAVNRNLPTPKFRVVESDNKLDIISSAFHLSYDKKKFSTNGLSASIVGKVTLWGSYWRYGQDQEGNLGGTSRTLDLVDGRCDMGRGILSRQGYSALDDSDSMLFENDGFVSPRREGDRVDGYLFCYGPDYRGAMASFYAISGRQPLVPRYSLGCWFSRYYAYTASEYLGLMDRFQQEEIPLSVAVIDMDWHLVHGDEVPHAGWTGYTWDKKLFPDPVGFAAELRKRGLRMTLNDHPHEGIHHHEEIYCQMAAVLGHDTSENAPILFDPTDPDFMRAFLQVLHRNLEDMGCDFWWIDWQQGPHSKVPGLDPLWLLNHFNYVDHLKTTKETQPLIFSRYAGPGSHRYPVGFSGDTIITWNSLRFQPEFTATASNIGYGWWSHDIGGHMFGYRDDELSARWVQLGVWSPLLRLHSSDSRWSGKEPWKYRGEAREAMRSAMQLRHRLVPYIYSHNVANSLLDPQPLVQPMYWDHPMEDEAYQHLNQYKFGSELIVCPIVDPVDPKTNLAKVTAWLPEKHGRFVDIFSGRVYSSGRVIDLYRALTTYPVLAKEGAIIPLDHARVPENGCKNPESLEVLVVVGADGKFDIWEDPRDDAASIMKKVEDSESLVLGHRQMHVQYEQAAGRVTTKGWGKLWAFRFPGIYDIRPEDVRVFVNNAHYESASVRVERNTGAAASSQDGSFKSGLLVQLADTSQYDDDIRIELGSDPQISVVSPHDEIEALLLDSQVEFAVKDAVWKVVTSKQSNTSKLAHLQSMALDKSLAGPLFELLSADTRLA
ncbi:Glycoside hydrolase, family 31 [Fusarium keratoplasticum]|nr:Glycoside hydrolase, family 31 [Fusarium keratoplasticum]